LIILLSLKIRKDGVALIPISLPNFSKSKTFWRYLCSSKHKLNFSSSKSTDFANFSRDSLVIHPVFFPLNGPDSVLAAEATYCADDQGKYWEYHDELYNNWGGEKTGWITRESLEKFAKSVDLELEKFNLCLDVHKYRQKVLDLEKFGRDIGINATPSFLIFNDNKIIKISGNQPIEVFKKAISDL